MGKNRGQRRVPDQNQVHLQERVYGTLKKRAINATYYYKYNEAHRVQQAEPIATQNRMKIDVSVTSSDTPVG